MDWLRHPIVLIMVAFIGSGMTSTNGSRSSRPSQMWLASMASLAETK